MGESVNVRVAVRARPLSSKERERGCSECVTMKGKVATIVDENGNSRQFSFDYCYWTNTAQSTVYEDLARPIVEGAIDGFNGCLFAYGQTGSGKTHSMMGTGEDLGIVPLMNSELFGKLEEISNSRKSEFLVTAAYMEIYNEVIRDLLNPSEKQLKVREHPKLGIYVEHLAELVVTSANEIASLLDQGNQVKQVAATNMNDRSSRSHCCFFINIQQRKVEEIGSGVDAIKRETSLSAKINLIDLAGSERASKTGATGDRLKEGAAINQSLSSLGQVINMLAEGKKGHIPYRNSKLTRVLQPALGGNARTVMIAAISPADYNYEETLSTLQYASRASRIKNETKRNENVSDRMIRELREEVEMLREQMKLLQSNSSPEAGSDQKKEDLLQTINALENAKQEQWNKVQMLSQAYEEERKKNLANSNKVISVMQNVKEQNVALLKQMKEVQVDRSKLSSAFKVSKNEYVKAKSVLEQNMKEYSDLSSQEATPDLKAKLKSMQLELKSQKTEFLIKREKVNALKTKLEDNQAEEMSLRAEIAAQKSVIEGDEKLRKAIQEEERQKMEVELETGNNVYLQEKLAAEKARLVKESEAEIKKLQQLYENRVGFGSTTVSQLQERVETLELECIQHSIDKQLLAAEIKENRKRESQLQERFASYRAEAEALLLDFHLNAELDRVHLFAALQKAAADAVALHKGKTPS